MKVMDKKIKEYVDRIEHLLSRINELERQLESSNQIREAEKKILIKEIGRNKKLEDGIAKHEKLNVVYNPGIEKYCSTANLLGGQ